MNGEWLYKNPNPLEATKEILCFYSSIWSRSAEFWRVIWNANNVCVVTLGYPQRRQEDPTRNGLVTEVLIINLFIGSLLVGISFLYPVFRFLSILRDCSKILLPL